MLTLMLAAAAASAYPPIKPGRWQITSVTTGSTPPMPAADIERGKPYVREFRVSPAEAKLGILAALSLPKDCKVAKYRAGQSGYAVTANCPGNIAHLSGSYGRLFFQGKVRTDMGGGVTYAAISGRYIGR